MIIYGYARVSTIGQTLAAQEAALHEAGAAKSIQGKDQRHGKPSRSTPPAAENHRRGRHCHRDEA
jgi:DNA invertase Pin-like site-specific DNA recombinase